MISHSTNKEYELKSKKKRKKKSTTSFMEPKKSVFRIRDPGAENCSPRGTGGSRVLTSSERLSKGKKGGGKEDENIIIRKGRNYAAGGTEHLEGDGTRARGDPLWGVRWRKKGGERNRTKRSSKKRAKKLHIPLFPKKGTKIIN